MPGLLGTDVLYRRWKASPAPADPKAAFLLVHGLGAHSARWEFLAGHSAARGFASYAIELRGFGGTPERPRGHVASFKVWDRDVLALRDMIGRDFPGKKIFLMGESMGGLIAFDLAGRRPGLFAGLVVISPAFKNGMRFPLSAYAKLAFLLPFNPRLLIDLPFTSGMATRDAEYAAIMDANPDELRQASLKLLAGFLPVQARAPRLARNYATPSLFLLSGIDHLVDERANRKMFERMTAADKTLIEYPEMFHALNIDLGREKVFEDILGWTEKRL
jgi:alpha-beta hydrolase superfamily lysophospholipase